MLFQQGGLLWNAVAVSAEGPFLEVGFANLVEKGAWF
jgi:hypothetical protein